MADSYTDPEGFIRSPNGVVVGHKTDFDSDFDEDGFEAILDDLPEPPSDLDRPTAYDIADYDGDVLDDPA